DYPMDKTVHGLFSERASERPDATALVFEGKEMGYGELERRSNQLARRIRSQYLARTGSAMGPDTLVPLFLERGLEMVVSILAVMKAGGAYVPIDPGYPHERVGYILSDTGCEIVLSQQSLMEDPETPLAMEGTIAVDLSGELYSEEDHGPLDPVSGPR
ncbi:AMP-binding protein, partial [Croceitalea sp. MTPC5]|uniref:AMP-binding protein n=1 Tax=Croceitalea sp. MTPC5 TaxID=3056565 RepID=UPI0030D0215E